MFTSSGPTCALLSSASCWRRRLRRASCGRQSPIWHNGRGSIRRRASPCDSASPLSSAGITVRSLSAPIRSACSGARCAAMLGSSTRSATPSAARCSRNTPPTRAGASNCITTISSRWPRRNLISSRCRPIRRCAASCVPTVSTSAGVSPRAQPDGAEQAEARIADREIRSYEAEYVNALVALGLPPLFKEGADGTW